MDDKDLQQFYHDRPVCVTGGAGFIGSHLAERLLRMGALVTVLDDLSGSDDSHPRAMGEKYGRQYRFLHGSILDDEALAEALDRAAAGKNGEKRGVVFHEAALGSVPASLNDPFGYHRVNAEGTMRVCAAATKAGVRRLVYAASSSAYGEQPELPKVETQLPQPLSPYAQSKLAGEHILAVWAHCYGLSTVSLRYFNIFGPRQRADTAYAAVIAAFASALLDGREAVIYGDGGQTRDFTYIENVISANLRAGATKMNLRGEVMNIGTGERITINELYTLMAEYLGVEEKVRHDPPRAGDVRHSLADISLARKLIGYAAPVSAREGLKPTVEWYRQQYEQS